MNYVLFGAYATIVTAAASFICGYIYQEVIVNGN